MSAYFWVPLCPLDDVLFESTDVFISVAMLFRTVSSMEKVKANIQRKNGQRKKDTLVHIRCFWSGPLSSRLHDNTIYWPLGNPTHKCHGSQRCHSVAIEWVCEYVCVARERREARGVPPAPHGGQGILNYPVSFNSWVCMPWPEQPEGHGDPGVWGLGLRLHPISIPFISTGLQTIKDLMHGF